MVTVDLITGFLGAGKTTFIHQYIQYLRKQGLSIRIIENEFGDSNIDTHFLEEEHLEIEDLAGMCMCCVGKSAFIQMLEESAKSGCDRIIVEPSGIYDVDEFFDTLSLPQLQSVCEIGSIITIIDPLELDHLSKESKYLMFSQLLASGYVIMSKTQYLDTRQKDIAIEKINALMEEFGCPGLLAPIYSKPWNELTNQDFKEFMDAFYGRYVHDRMVFNHMEVYQSLEVNVTFKDEKTMTQNIKDVFTTNECGLIYRIKGYTQDIDGNLYEVNCTSKTVSIRKVKQDVLVELIIIGEHIRRKQILKCLEKDRLL